MIGDRGSRKRRWKRAARKWKCGRDGKRGCGTWQWIMGGQRRLGRASLEDGESQEMGREAEGRMISGNGTLIFLMQLDNRLGG